MKVLLTIPMDQAKVKHLEDLGFEILFENERTSDFSGNYSDIEIMMTYSAFSKINIEQFPKLKWIQLTSIGFDQVTPEFQDIMITNNHGGYSPQIGEWVVGMILAFEKKLHAIYDNQKQNHWKTLMNLTSLKGKTIVFIGTGTLAQESAKRLKAFDVTIIGLNQSGRAVEYFDETYPLEDLYTVLNRADHVVNCLPATKQTRHLINRDFIMAMQPGSHLHNVSRGAIVNEQDLIDHHDHLGMIALDVFETEPLPKDSPLWNLPNIIISSHNSWVDEHIPEVRFELLLRNLLRYQAGERLDNIINFERGY